MYIRIGDNSAAERIVLQVIQHPIHLIHHAFLIPALYSDLIAIGLSNGTGLVSPLVPHMTVQIMNISGFFLINPQNLIHAAFQGCLSQGDCRKFFS